MPIGVTIGSVASGQLARASITKTFIGLNILGVLGCVVSCVNTYSTVILGRFVYGCVGGVMISLTPKMLQQTIPMDIYNRGYGASTNLVIEAYRVVDLFLVM
jgi:MFS family permease